MQRKAKSSSKSHAKSSKLPLIASLLSSAVILMSALFITINRQYLSDSIVGLFYEPKTSVVELRDSMALTSDGTRIFYATQPEVSHADSFNSQCPRQELKNPIIGCYASNDRIYVFNIENADLNGIEEVTGAHELLHAVWHRMSNAERESVATYLKQVYEQMATSDLKERMAYYERTEPGEFLNELHSIIGTEIAVIDPILEKHYAKYFQDRGKVVDYFEQYDAVYTELYNRADALTIEIEQLGKTITEESTLYDANVESLSDAIDSFNRRADRGDFSSEQAFYAERLALVNRSNQLEIKRAAINESITTYDKLFEEYNEISSKIESLDKSMDSFQMLETVPGI